MGVQNVFPSEVVTYNGRKYVQFGQRKLAVETGLQGTVNFSFRPEDVVLSPTPQPNNSLPGVIDSIERQGLLTRVVIDVEENEVVALLPVNGDSMDILRPGASVFCFVHPKKINVFPDR